jgi:hypothetical protein
MPVQGGSPHRTSILITNLLQHVVAKQLVGMGGHVFRSREDVSAIGVR